MFRKLLSTNWEISFHVPMSSVLEKVPTEDSVGRFVSSACFAQTKLNYNFMKRAGSCFLANLLHGTCSRKCHSSLRKLIQLKVYCVPCEMKPTRILSL